MSNTKEKILRDSQTRHGITSLCLEDSTYEAMEEYSQQQISEYKQKLKAEVNNMRYYDNHPSDLVEENVDVALLKVLTLIDKI